VAERDFIVHLPAAARLEFSADECADCIPLFGEGENLFVKNRLNAVQYVATSTIQIRPTVNGTQNRHYTRQCFSPYLDK